MSDAYSAAYGEAVFFSHTHRRLRRVTGKAPTAMLAGILSGSMPPALEPIDSGALRGRVPCSALLTPKGKMISDLRVARIENGDGGALLLDLPEAGLAGATAHFATYLPPRMARVEAFESETAILVVVGPGAADLVTRLPMSLPLDPADISSLAEGDERILPAETETGLRIVRTGDVAAPSFGLTGDASTIRRHRSRLLEAAVPEGDDALWAVLRLEKGRPEFGVEMDEDTIPLEAGIQDRCIDNTKGCYTGQEVVVRIRDRGHVNRHLRGLLLGDAPPPPSGTLLFSRAGEDKPVGVIRSSAHSPRFGQAIALGYVRREVDPPSSVALGSPDGPDGQVRALASDGWLLVDGDPTPYP